MLGATVGRSEYGCTRTRERNKAQKPKRLKQDDGTVAASAPSFLSLPDIPKSIPRSYVFDTSSAQIANIALHLLDLGLVAETEVSLPLAQVITQALTRWCRTRTQELKCFAPTIVVSDSIDGMREWSIDVESVLSQESIEPGTPHVALGIYFHDSKSFTLKEKCDPLHMAEPSFMEFVMSRLYQSLGVMFAVTPELAHYTAETFYWDTWDDQEEPELSKEVFYSIIPEWVANPSNTQEEEQVFTHCLNHSNSEITLIAQHVLTWKELDHARQQNMLPYYPDNVSEDGLTTMEAGTWVSWDENEIFNRIMDDWGEYHMQGNTTALHKFFVVPATKDGLQNALTKLGCYFARLLWADKLLSLLGTER